MTAYSSDKALFHLDRLAILQDHKQPYPVHVQLIISDYCNQNCGFCAYRMANYSSNQLFKTVDINGKVNNNPRRMIPWPKLAEIVEDCAAMGVKAIQLTGGGEPTVHPQFDRLVEMILEKGINVGLVTNGLLLKQPRADLIAKVGWVRVSVDCATPESYARIRDVPPQEFGIVANNVKRLTSVPGRRAVVGLGFVVTQENHQEILSAVTQFKEWGADNVRISAIFQNDGASYFDGIYDSIQEQIAQSLLLNDSRFTVFNNFGSRLGDLELGNPDYKFCGYMNLTTYIGGDQNVYSCCVNAYNEHGKIGSVANQRFKELWDSQPKQDFFSGFDARGCTRCMFNEKNRFINNILRNPTVHDSFV